MSWFKQPARHVLAAKGIPTGRFQAAQLDSVKRGSRVGGILCRDFSYGRKIAGLRRHYDEMDEVERIDYEAAVQPIFDTLAEADLLCDRGDLQGTIARLQIASDQYARLAQDFNVIRDEDSKEYLAVTQALSQKTVTKSRIGGVPRPSSQMNVTTRSGAEDALHTSQSTR